MADGYIAIDLTLATAKARQKLLQFRTDATKTCKSVEGAGGKSGNAFAESWSGASDRTKTALRKVGGAAKSIGKAAAAGCAMGATAIAGIAKQASDSYASYEQLVGGVEKLYGDSAGKVEKYAADAYKTVGMSANDYMETATQFSAAMTTSLGGDLDKSADQTQKAMEVMSDNVNVFGSNFEDVSNAFKGFSKQNYTMLDNLGIAGGMAA